jgi:hypothetical protein
MNGLYYIGLDVHKKHVSYVIKNGAGERIGAGQVAATRPALSGWTEGIGRPGSGALEPPLFSGWMYDHLRTYAEQRELAQPALVEAMTCASKKNDRRDAAKVCELLRCEVLPRC